MGMHSGTGRTDEERKRKDTVRSANGKKLALNYVRVVQGPKRLTRVRALNDWKEAASERGIPGLIRDLEVFKDTLQRVTSSRRRSQAKTRLDVYEKHRDEILAVIPPAP